MLSIGTRVRIVKHRDRPYSGCPLGEAVVMGTLSNLYHYVVRVGNNTISNSAFDYEVQPVKTPKEDLISQIAEHHQAIIDIQSKLDWIEEVGEDGFDEKEHRLYQVLNIIESSKTKKEKVKALKELSNP